MASYEKKWGLLLSEMITITDEMTTIGVANFMNFRWGGKERLALSVLETEVHDRGFSFYCYNPRSANLPPEGPLIL